ncbi:MAG TPA: AbrB/MazE/SpoVT family DNA-binding domain-containing protein [Ktedonobacteraceae bacterium]|nr:AbrB/MazE/SpoVT family DNA-binding domain-containing protein [Ktedonobacteraceae bacterium]
MREIIANITSKGQVTIPAEIRDHLGINNHNKIAFIIDEEGFVRLKFLRYPDVDSLVGAAGSLSKPLSWNEMRKIAYEDRFSASYEAENNK